jgi:hypothetical protein
MMMAVPAIAREAANMMVVDVTQNPADLLSFSIECVKDGATWWACRIPITPETYAMLPQMQQVTGGVYEVLREYSDERVDLMTFEDALTKHNLNKIEVPDVE